MNLQAYEGYFENGTFYPVGQVVNSPVRRRAFVTVLDEPTKKEISLKDSLSEAQAQAKINGTSEMTLDEINDIIAECRREMREGQS
jgi:tRNA(Ser,Leu) C12 N-acetylase TAN1